ncbi:ABC transporter ATP-binding protein [Sphingomonas sp. CJ20]
MNLPALRLVERNDRTTSGAPVVVRDLSVAFGANQVLDRLSLSIAPGEFVAIVGRSGCGKSTLLRAILGLAPIGGGEIQVDRPAARLVFQEPRLLPWATVRANVAVGAHAAHDAAERDRLIDARLAEVGLADKAEHWPAALSGGQRQRVALARALLSRPTLLALDEPLGALDALTRIEMQTLIETVWAHEGFSALLVTHDVAEAVALADRVVVMEAGRIALDLTIPVPRPRRHGDAALAALEGRILDRLLGR